MAMGRDQRPESAARMRAELRALAGGPTVAPPRFASEGEAATIAAPTAALDAASAAATVAARSALGGGAGSAASVADPAARGRASMRPWIAAASIALAVVAIGAAMALPGRSGSHAPPGVPLPGGSPIVPALDDATDAAAIAPAERTFAFDAAVLAADGNVRRESREAHSYQEDLGKGVAIEMVAIPGGAFQMGDASGTYSDETPQHRVTISPFYLSRYEVTQAEWRAVASGLPRVSRVLDPDPAAFKSDDRPVEQVSWEDAMEFCERVSRKTHHAYHLPSEAEWEYAARAGTTTPFAFGAFLTPTVANFDATASFGGGPRGSAPTQTVPVGTFGVANAFGLSDMHGNVAEWCLGEYHPSYDGAPTDGRPWVSSGDNDRHVLRGGSWSDLAVDCRSANRYSYPRDGRQRTIGFRLAMSLPNAGGAAAVASAPGTTNVPAAETAAAPPAGTDVAGLPVTSPNAAPPAEPRVDRRGSWADRPAAARLFRRRAAGSDLPPDAAR
jgi:formylglycine-generating enzyme required for sulfatase activity